MKANAPERLYLSETIYSTYLYQVPDPDDETAVEYTRTNAFVEMACSWLKENADMYEAFDSESKSYYMDKDKLVEDFKEYMKEE